ncbi:PspC domain-containing protein [Nonomuraea sp. NPDC050783]|uniref:PspC domain-containing protein n=1 Tax=Nonomuraea sp. NPDC050783 TaxID=3154634 RepID=UPI0034662F1A
MSEYHEYGTQHTDRPVKKLRRTEKGRIVAGVCSGVGEYVGIDPNLIRIALAVVTLFGGLGVGLYAIGWLLLPDEHRDTSIVQDLINKQQNRGGGSTDWTTGGEHKPQP